jgi:hypothetical protein
MGEADPCVVLAWCSLHELVSERGGWLKGLVEIYVSLFGEKLNRFGRAFVLCFGQSTS